MSKISVINQGISCLSKKALGIPQGGILANNQFKLMATSDLKAMNAVITERIIGREYGKISKDAFERVANYVKDAAGITLEKPQEGNILEYLHAHGASQIWDETAKKSLWQTCEQLAEPLKTLAKMLKLTHKTGK